MAALLVRAIIAQNRMTDNRTLAEDGPLRRAGRARQSISFWRAYKARGIGRE
jgi:hypothetical protein